MVGMQRTSKERIAGEKGGKEEKEEKKGRKGEWEKDGYLPGFSVFAVGVFGDEASCMTRETMSCGGMPLRQR